MRVHSVAQVHCHLAYFCTFLEVKHTNCNTTNHCTRVHRHCGLHSLYTSRSTSREPHHLAGSYISYYSAVSEVMNKLPIIITQIVSHSARYPLAEDGWEDNYYYVARLMGPECRLSIGSHLDHRSAIFLVLLQIFNKSNKRIRLFEPFLVIISKIGCFSKNLNS